MPDINAFHLQEITSEIAQYLPYHARFRCLLVCRDWYRSFLPEVWRDYRIIPGAIIRPHTSSSTTTTTTISSLSNSSSSSSLDPSIATIATPISPVSHFALATLRKHAHLIQDLFVSTDISTLEYYTDKTIIFSRLSRLRIMLTFSRDEVETNIVTKAIMGLIRRHRHLLRIMFIGSETRVVEQHCLWLALSDERPFQDSKQHQQQQQPQLQPRLQDLTLNSTELRLYNLPRGGWNLLRGLETLSLYQVKILTLVPEQELERQRELLRQLQLHQIGQPPRDPLPVVISPLLPPLPTLTRSLFSNLTGGCRIQTLVLSNDTKTSCEIEFALLRECQQLQSLTWKRLTSYRASDLLEPYTPPIVRGIRDQGFWPFLKEIDLLIHQHQVDVFRDLDYAEMIAHLKSPLKKLHLDASTFGTMSVEALLFSDKKHQDKDSISSTNSGSSSHGGASGGGGEDDRGHYSDPNRQYHHRSSLESISLRNCNSVDGSMVHQIMCSLPRLRLLHAPYVTEDDILADPRPWMCDQLEDLKVCLYRKLPVKSRVEDQFLSFLSVSSSLSSTSPLSFSSTRPSSFVDRLASMTRLISMSIGVRDSVTPMGSPRLGTIWRDEEHIIEPRQKYGYLLLDLPSAPFFYYRISTELDPQRSFLDVEGLAKAGEYRVHLFEQGSGGSRSARRVS
ncbi:hypothetical protein BGZ83_001959 [Gryganskiella cystojenkinii]|nr:hypothetical protein BGZ83_001959 [Gryganskiella cystojenkinii]